MSAGTRVITLRIPPELLVEMEESMRQANETRFDAPYDRTSWMLAAIREKIAHLRRGRKRKSKRATRPPVEPSPPANI